MVNQGGTQPNPMGANSVVTVIRLKANNKQGTFSFGGDSDGPPPPPNRSPRAHPRTCSPRGEPRLGAPQRSSRPRRTTPNCSERAARTGRCCCRHHRHYYYRQWHWTRSLLPPAPARWWRPLQRETPSSPAKLDRVQFPRELHLPG